MLTMLMSKVFARMLLLQRDVVTNLFFRCCRCCNQSELKELGIVAEGKLMTQNADRSIGDKYFGRLSAARKQ